MRKPLHAHRFALGNPKLHLTSNRQNLFPWMMAILMVLFYLEINAQCTPSPGVIEGTLFEDLDYNGVYDANEEGVLKGEIILYNSQGAEVERITPSANGYFQFAGLSDGEEYTLILSLPSHYSPARHGADHLTDVRSLQSPACEVMFGMVDPTQYCDTDNPDVAVTCFVKGPDGVNDDMETLVYTTLSFNTQSNIAKIADKGSTGSVFGSAWASGNQTLYTSSFVKQDAFLKNQLGSIFASKFENGGFQTSEAFSLESLGIDLGSLSVTDAEDCEYGGQVGKYGIGGMEISPDERYLLAVNLYKKSIVVVDLVDTRAETTMEVVIPKSCQNGEMRPFGITYYQGSYYVTATCDASESKLAGDHNISVFTFDLASKTFDEVFSTSFTRSFWQDEDPDAANVAHWLMDIEFTNQGTMLLGIADRSSHRYCHPRTRMSNQYPDLLMVWNDNGTWKLESNGRAGNLTGSGVNNGQGPGGGEFFGEEFWILGPLYHPEIATGTLFTLPGSDEVVATVFDPVYNTFTGGLHRYNTVNGKKTGAIQLFSAANQGTFGKGSGLGNIIDMCGAAPVEIGNYVWVDEDENGLQNGSELSVEGLEISLYDDQCNLITTKTTNVSGEYYFNEELDYHKTYYVVVSDSRWNDATGKLDMNNKEYDLTLNGQGSLYMSNKAIIAQNMCNVLEGKWILPVSTSGPGFTNHQFDIGLVEAPTVVVNLDTFDLALMKTSTITHSVKLGQLISYEITIFNQGNVAAKNIEVVDYLPSGLSFPGFLNPGWGMKNGNLYYKIQDVILPGASKTIIVTTQVEATNDVDGYINYSEIVSAEDVDGNIRDDIDSTPDDTLGNDSGGEPDSINDNRYDDDGTEDEDDHDPASLKIFDLALIKTTNFDQTVKIGDDITYTIRVVNQGNMMASQFELVDYLPEGLVYSPADNNDWVMTNGVLKKTVVTDLVPGASFEQDVVLRVTPDAASGVLINYAEIVSAKGGPGVPYVHDFDSTPDEVKTNDKGGVFGSNTDDMLDGHGDIDEDDHDPSRVYVFDLALRKEVENAVVTASDQEVKYTFTVFNQGEMSARDIQVTDYLPEGFVFSPALNSGWSALNAQTLVYDITSPLAAGQSVAVELILFVEEDALGNTLINWGEISAAADETGSPAIDFDSNADGDQSNDIGGDVGQATDNMIDDHGVQDEDDHDPAVIYSEPIIQVNKEHDVSLAKHGGSHQMAGDTITFQLVAFNEGDYTIGKLVFIDYLPFFLTPLDPRWEPDPSGYTREVSVLNGDLPITGLAPGDSVIVELPALIDQNAFPGFVLNTAEIGYVMDIDQVDISLIDIDSKADFDPRNDVSDNPAEQQGGAGQGALPVEDDRAAFEFIVSTVERRSTCNCLNNETNENDGQFEDQIVVTSGNNETWYIDIVNDFYQVTSPNPPAPPTPFSIGLGGFQLPEVDLGNGTSEYTLNGRFIQGTRYYLVLKNFEAEVAIDVSGGQECLYDKIGIEGPVNVCIGSTQTYEVIDPNAGGQYSWSVDPVAGVFVGPSNGSRVRVEWANTAGGPYTLSVNETAPDNCVSPSSIQVTIGDEFAFSISCIQDANISLGPDCTTMITPQSLLTGGPYDYSSYNVMLSDEHGNPINGAVLDHTHLGKRIMAKVINSCTGNSCWSWLTVEDKLPPQIECFNDTIRCISLGQYAYPKAVDACDPFSEITLIDEIVEALDCDDNFIKRVTRKFVAEDNYGNQSDTCTQVIMLERIVLDSIVFPDSLTIANGKALQCNAFAMDTFGFPLPDSFGLPTYLGLDIYPQEYYCNVGVDYKDTELGQVGCIRKILREWRVFEWWCTQEVEILSYPQYIEITDTIAPTIEPILPHYVTTNARSCNADVFIDMPTVTENCNSAIRVDLVYPGGFIEDFTARTIVLPVDTNVLTFRAYDECYNVDSVQFTVVVEDNTPPVAVCDQFTSVGLTDTGYAYIYAETFDDLSYDNCDLKSMEVKRMDNGSNCGFNNTTFGPFVEFCCEDIGQNVMVLFKVTDKSGNENTCMVEVEVQDKIPPTIYCPPNDTIDCDFHYDTSDLSIFGEPIVHDNCEFTLTEHVFESVDQCREGYIERVWVAQDDNNRVTCSQRIYIINDSPFDSTDITWPLDFDTTECREGFLTPDLLPEENAFPMVDEDFCDLVGITYSDHRFAFTQNSQVCYKLLRKWEVINWCRFDSSTYDIWTHEQVIKVNNEIAPTITSSCEPISKCIFDDCEVGFIELLATATDDCTEDIELRWEYHIDLNKDGTDDFSNFGSGASIDASRILDLGEHSIRYVFEDRCGNRTVCTQEFNIFNCKPPTAYCKNGLIVDLIPMDLDGDGECDNEMVEIWAIDLNDNSTSQCDYPLTYSFGRDTSNKRVVFNCEDIGRNELEICVTDPRGFQSCCSTFVVVQDNNMMDCCPKIINKDCVQGPADVNLTDCMASTLPEDLMSMPTTARCEVDSIVMTYTDEDGTTGEVCEKIKRTWEVTLYLDGEDTTCVYTHCITIDNEFTEDSIVWPQDTLILLGCNPSLDTSNTGGVPVINGEYCDFVTLEFADEQVEENDEVCTYFERTWTVTNGCDNDKEFMFTQYIIFMNQAPPTLITPADITVNNDPLICAARVTLPPVAFTDCSSGVTIENDHNGGGANATGIFDVGITVVTFTATDSCGNVATGQTVVTVLDMEPPFLVCPDDLDFDCDVDLDTVDFGRATVTDNCGNFTLTIDTFSVLNECNIGTINRRFEARDTSGNVISCVQRITISNENPFDSTRITWPGDTVRVGACESTDPDSTGRPVIDITGVACQRLSTTFADTFFMDTCDGTPCNVIERKWTVVDTCQLDGQGGGVFCFDQRIEITGSLFMITCPNDTTIFCEDGIGDLMLYGDVMVTSDCGIDTIIRDSSANLNICEVGTITRMFTVRDTLGNQMMCSQVITVDIRMPFVEGRITWPDDTVRLRDCEPIDPDKLGEPVIDTSGLSCFNITVAFSDTTYMGTCDGNPCMITERTWTVMDLCQVDGSGAGVYTFTQIIEQRGGMISVNCPPDTMVSCEADFSDLSVFGSLTVTSTCGIDTIIRDSVIALGNCNLGTITRSILARDTLGNEVSCSQIISVVSTNPFGIGNITWPADTVILDGCTSSDPDSIMSRPVVDTSMTTCFDLSIGFVDSTSSSCMQTPCLLINRTWTIVDSCQLDTMGNGRWTFLQRIEVNDTTPPVFTIPVDTAVYLDRDNDSCEIVIAPLLVGVMDCSDSITITNNSPFAFNPNEDAGGLYPLGKHEFYFFAEDLCCNKDSVLAIVEVIDTISPRISCQKVFKTMVDTIVGVKFTAREHLVTLDDNCGQNDFMDFTISYSRDNPADSCRSYNCDSLRATGLPNLLYRETVYVTDQSGNVDSCDALLQIIDMSGCIVPTLVTVGGQIKTSNDAYVEAAEVDLLGLEDYQTSTSDNGMYYFNDMSPGGEYMLEPHKDTNPLEGITTKDLLMIQRHLLGIKSLDNPYQHIAADVNRNDEVAASDIILLRRMLLGYYSKFPSNTSWRFVDGEYVFPDPMDPWFEVFPETYEINPLENTMFVDFIGVKTGDVSGDAGSGLNGTQTRSDQPLVLEVERDDAFIHIIKPEGDSYQGLQFTLEFEPGDDRFEVMFGTDQVQDHHFGYHSIDGGVLTVAIDEMLDEDRTVLFSIPLKAVRSDVRLTSNITASLAYDMAWTEVPVILRDNHVGILNGYALYQNRPNPFETGTVIGFELPEAQSARLTIMNMGGQLVYTAEGDYERGYNEIEINEDVLGQSGVYYYRLDCKGYSQTLKMINID